MRIHLKHRLTLYKERGIFRKQQLTNSFTFWNLYRKSKTENEDDDLILKALHFCF